MEPPGKVIRSLRQALHMSQAQLGRAAGWSASTISSWERGRATPSRLAFKTILAFAEERGVRYRPASESAARELLSSLPPDRTALPTLRLSSHIPSTELTVLDAEPPLHPVRDESLGSRRWTAVAGEGLAAHAAHAAAVERVGWRAEANFRLAVETRRHAPRRIGYVAATMAALALGIGVGARLHTSARPAVERAATTATDAGRTADVARAVVPPPAAAALARRHAPDIEAEEPVLPWGERVGFPAVVAEGEPEAALDGASPPAAAEPALQRARLESIVALDGVWRATFRVGDRSITLVEGDQLGAQAIALIDNDEVTLVGAGAASRVRLGYDTPLE